MSGEIEKNQTKGLLLFVRENELPVYHEDWRQIASQVSTIDPDIQVKLFTKTHPPSADLNTFGDIPTLAVVLYNMVPRIPRGRIIRNRRVSKLDQLRRYRQCGIPFPASAVFRWGMSPDPAIYGDYVVLKPLDLQAGSKGHALLWATSEIYKLQPQAFNQNHPMRRFNYIIQRYIHTGEHATSTRILNLCQSNVLSYVMQLKAPIDLSQTPVNQNIATNGGERDRYIRANKDQLRIASQAAACFPNIPVQAMDVITEQATGRHYVLESNLGGNTWHFSSRFAQKMREEMGNGARRSMLEQFDCYKTSAEALVRATHLLAI